MNKSKNIIIIFGPQATGKMTVGKALQEKTGLRLLYNHMYIEPFLNFFEFGSPPFMRLADNFRKDIFQEVMNSDFPGLVLTFLWWLDSEEDLEYLNETTDYFKKQGASIFFVELKTDLQTRLKRNKNEDRLLAKPSKRNLERSEKFLLEGENKVQNSNGKIPLPYPHLIIDNTELSPEDAADIIIQKFKILE